MKRNNIVSYSFDELNNSDYGGAIFQELSIILAQKHICFNIIPASMPSYGGDRGIDGRYFQCFTNASKIEQMISGTTQEINDSELIIATSIRKDFQRKLKDDIKNIVSKNNVKYVYFLTNQKISPENKKLEFEENLSKEFGVSLRVFDKSFVTTQGR